MLIQGYFHEFQVKIAYRKCTKFWTFFHTVRFCQLDEFDRTWSGIEVGWTDHLRLVGVQGVLKKK